MGPEVATTYLGVLTDVLGVGLDELLRRRGGDPRRPPPGDFKNEFLRAYAEGLEHRPETTNGTVNSDVLEHFVPGFTRTTTVERILGSPWPS
ncbi:hypothetical protein ACFQV8_27265 [Pseudonocardia benzenivorans]